MKDVPKTYMGKKFGYETTYRSPYQQETREEAERELERMKKMCPASQGWLKLKDYIERTPRGFRAVLLMAKYY